MEKYNCEFCKDKKVVEIEWAPDDFRERDCPYCKDKEEDTVALLEE
jgi:hypothetical protein